MDFREATELYSAEPTREKLYEVADLLLKEMTVNERIRLNALCKEVFKIIIIVAVILMH